METTARTAAPETGRGAAPKVFSAVLERLIADTADLLEAGGMTPEMEDREFRRLALLRMAAASNLPFPKFYDCLSEYDRDAAKRFSDLLETLEAVYEAERQSE